MEFATGALGTLLPKLGKLLLDEYYLHKDAKKNIQFLKEELESIHAALCIVGEKAPEELNDLVKIWSREVRELSYDMEDMVDTFLVRVEGPERPSKRSAKRFIKDMMGFTTKAKIRHEIDQEIKDIKKRVMEVAARRERYNLEAITPAKPIGVDPRLMSLYTKAGDLVGIDEAREELITRMTKEDDTLVQLQRIVSVVGFGGLGKTTLAKAVYDKLKGRFDRTAFVSVGRNPDLKKVFKDILIDLGNQGDMENLDEMRLINKIHESLQNERYFIVIDDVWDIQTWTTIELALLKNDNGSRIIITTRTHEVARKAGGLYELQPLSHENSRKLFFARIFSGESKLCDDKQEEVSDKILSKCGGIPLAIITMASLLAGKSMEEWSDVHRSIGFGQKVNMQIENTMKILSFSYYDLPSHLRACLLHLSLFPEDYFIEKRPLIWMWIAEGFVRKEQGGSLFEIGEGYFNELVNRSMIQQEGDVTECGCRLHDMVLDLIRSIASEENFITILDNNNEGASSSKQRVRRLALQNNNGTVEPHMGDMQQVRSFVSIGCDINKGVPLSRFKLLRVLHTSGHLEHLRNLHHLRYLRLSGGTDAELPGEIGALKFLETLDVGGYRISNEVAASLGLLTQLSCLRFRGPVDIVPDGIGKLTSLEELQIHYENFNEPWRQFVKELGRLRELRLLRVGMPYKWPYVTEVQIDLAESLSNLEKMEHLLLTVSQRLGGVSFDIATWEAAGFRLPTNLRQLLMYRVRFSPMLPSFCINNSCLPNLSHLSLYVNKIDDEGLKILGEMLQLQFLEVDAWHAIVTTDAAGGGHLFQKLRHCIMTYKTVWMRSSKDGSGAVSFPMQNASLLLGSERKDSSSSRGVTPTLMPSIHHLNFEVHTWELKHHGDCRSQVLEYFASQVLEYFVSLEKVTVDVHCEDASAVAVEEVEAALQNAAGIHPNCPTLEMERWGEESMISDQEVSEEDSLTSEVQSDVSEEEDVQSDGSEEEDVQSNRSEEDSQISEVQSQSDTPEED